MRGYKVVAIVLLVLFAAASLPLFASASCVAGARVATGMADCDKPCCPLKAPAHSGHPDRVACEAHCALAAVPTAELLQPLDREHAAVVATETSQRHFTLAVQPEGFPLMPHRRPPLLSFSPLRI